MGTVLPIGGVCPSPRMFVMVRPAGPVAVAVNVTGSPVRIRPGAVASSMLVPAVGPSVQLPTVAMPSVPVVGKRAVTLPLAGRKKSTSTPLTGFPY